MLKYYLSWCLICWLTKGYCRPVIFVICWINLWGSHVWPMFVDFPIPKLIYLSPVISLCMGDSVHGGNCDYLHQSRCDTTIYRRVRVIKKSAWLFEIQPNTKMSRSVELFNLINWLFTITFDTNSLVTCSTANFHFDRIIN
jgi:hypothetical protein